MEQKQLLINLCTNAAHAMHEKGGTLTVSLFSTHLDATSPNPSGLKLGDYATMKKWAKMYNTKDYINTNINVRTNVNINATEGLPSNQIKCLLPGHLVCRINHMYYSSIARLGDGRKVFSYLSIRDYSR